MNRGCNRRAVMMLALAVSAGGALLAGTARGQIFVTNYTGSSIGEYTTSGATVNASLVSGMGIANPIGIAVSGSDLFVTNISLDTIGEYTTSGATVNTSLVSGLNNPIGIAVSGSDLFVVNNHPATIEEYTTSGATVNASLVPGLYDPYAIAVSGSDLFVSDQALGTIAEYTTSGAMVNAALVSGLSGPCGIVVSGSDLFVTNGNSGTIGEYTTSGATVNASLVSGLSSPQGIAVSGPDLFVAIGGNNGGIGEYTTSGATVNASLVSGLNGLSGIAVAVPSLTWNNTGAGGPTDGVTWDATNNNWNNGGSPSAYADGDNVTFNDTNSGHYAVTLNSVVNPLSVTFNNSAGNYTVSGTGSIAGATSLIKAGTGTVTLSTANSYSGGTTISSGILNIQNATALGATTGGTTVSSGATLQIQNNITVGAQALTISGSGASGATGALENVSGTNSYGGLVTLGAASTISSDAGTLNLTNSGTITGAGYGLTLTGAGSGSIAGIIGTTTGTLTKTGTGTWMLSGASTFTGGTTISSGTLTAANTSGSASGSGNVTINGGVLASGAVGSISGNVLAGSGSHTIAPGGIGSIGSLFVGGLTTSNLTTLNFDVGSGSGEVTNGDLLTLGSGGVNIGSGTVLTFGGTLNAGNDYRLIGDTAGGSVVGQINLSHFTLPSAAGYTYSLSTSVDPGYIDLVYASAGPPSLTWNNTGAGAPTDGVTWDTNTVNWLNGSNPATYADGNGVTFNDTNNGHYAVALNTVVNPSSVTFSNSAGNYVVSGSGGIAGAASITKSGTGAVTLGTANTYSGGTMLQAGTIIIGNNAALGTGTLTVGATAGNTAMIQAGSDGPHTIGNAINLQTDLNVGGASNLTLTGVISNTGGLTMVGSGVLTLNGTNTFTGAVTVSSGTVVQDTSLTCDVVNNATFTYNGGGLTGRLTSTGVANFNANFTAGNGMENDGLSIIGADVNMTFNGAGLDNEGSMTMTGGILSPSQTSANTNNGTMTLSGTTLVQLGSAGVLNNTGSMYLSGTIINGAGGQLNNNASGAINGTGTIQSAFTNSGLLAIGAGGTMNISKAFSNAGIIQLTNSGLTGGTVTNSGTINGSGNVSSTTVNASNGTIEASGGNLSFGGALSNQSGGLLTADAGAKLIVTQGLAANAGIINLTGGTFDNNGHALNNTGQISGYGIFRFGGTGLTNNASVTFSGGTSTINGNVTNAVGQTINVKFNPAIFTGNVVNSGTFKATSTTVTFAGTYTGGFTSDPSTDIFQSNVLVPRGSSMTGGSGDQYYMSSGTFNNIGTFNNGGLLQSSDPTTNSGSFTQSGTQNWTSGTTFTNTAGTATFQSDTGSTTSSPLSINVTGGLVTFSSTQHLAGLSVAAGATVKASIASPDSAIVTGSLNNSGLIDLNGNDLIVQGSSGTVAGNLAIISSELKAGFNAHVGYWNGATGVVSTAAAADARHLTTLGYRQSDGAPFDGVNTTTADTLVKYTYYGDADLNGIVNGADYQQIDKGFGMHLSGWSNGDFNYDGVVDGSDYSLIDNTFNQITATGASPLAILAEGSDLTPEATTGVPEPTTVALLNLAAISFLGRRRRKF